MDKPVIIVGGGGHGRVVIEAAMLSAMPPAGVVDPALARGSMVCDVRVLGGDEAISDDALRSCSVHVAITAMAKRRRLRRDLEARGAAFATIRHPRCIVSPRAHIGRGCFLAAGAIVGPGAALADGVIVNTGAQVDHDCAIGADSHIAPGAVLAGGVRCGEGVFIASGAVIAPNISIGAGATVGAGAVVLRDVPAGATVYGVPAKPKT